MADLPQDFWAGWVTLITLISLGGMSWLVYSVYFSQGHDKPSPVWDENLSEGTNPNGTYIRTLVVSDLSKRLKYMKKAGPTC